MEAASEKTPRILRPLIMVAVVLTTAAFFHNAFTPSEPRIVPQTRKQETANVKRIHLDPVLRDADSPSFKLVLFNVDVENKDVVEKVREIHSSYASSTDISFAESRDVVGTAFKLISPQNEQILKGSGIPGLKMLDLVMNTGTEYPQ